jgi:hypothetical protein
MLELLRTNNLVFISWLSAYLGEARIPVVVLDTHASIVEGSAGAIPRRIMVEDGDLSRAQWLLRQAGEELDND